MDGLGTIMLEELAPGSASIREIIGTTLVLTRAEQKPHRQKILQELRALFPSRRAEMGDMLQRVRDVRISVLPEYEMVAAIAWGALRAGVNGSRPFLERTIISGWDIARHVVDEESITFCLVLYAASNFPAEDAERDLWAFKAFEPIATIGSKAASNTSLI